MQNKDLARYKTGDSVIVIPSNFDPWPAKIIKIHRKTKLYVVKLY